ncbi:MAG: hypothetical protein HQK95_02205 [Nitrospirae bacterium]|nr:hypothetical protein [Nitrospirota bacterium]
MRATNSKQELYHSIFGSILDRTEMTPYLMLHAYDYKTALSQATKMMGNRGFDIKGGDAPQNRGIYCLCDREILDAAPLDNRGHSVV